MLQDIYNFLLDAGMDPVTSAASQLQQKMRIRRNSSYLNALRRYSSGGDIDFDELMNGEIRKKLKIVPSNVRQVFFFFLFMKILLAFRLSKADVS